MHTITIPQTTVLSYDGTEQQFIDNANKLSIQESGGELDSLDSGDATGFFLTLLDCGHDEDDPIRFEDGTTVYFERRTELFVHSEGWAN